MSIQQQDILFAWDASHGIVPTVGGEPSFSRGGDKWVRTRARGGSPLYTRVRGDQVGFSWVEKDGVLLPRRALDLELGGTPITDDSGDQGPGTVWESVSFTYSVVPSIFGDDFDAHRIENNSGSFGQGVVSAGTFSGNPETFSVIMEGAGFNSGPTDWMGVFDTDSSSWVIRVDNVNFDDGTANLVDGTRITVETLAVRGPNGGRVLRIQATGTGTAGNARTVRWPRLSDGSAVISHHAHHEEHLFATSPVVFTGAPVTRPAEQVYVAPVFPPQDFAWYTMAVARSFAEAGTNREWWDVGDRVNGPGVNAREDSNADEKYELVSEDDGSNVAVSGVTLAGVAPGSVVELAGAYENATGKVRLIGRVDGGAWQDGGIDTPASWTPPTAWARDRMAYNETASLTGQNRGAQVFTRDLKALASAMDNDPFSAAAADVAEELADVPIGPHRAGHG